MKEHAGAVAMGMITPTAGGILQSMLLCEIESFQTMKGNNDFGTY